jgi:glycine hydroxymethyltransferase
MTTMQATVGELSAAFLDRPVTEVDSEIADRLAGELRQQQTTLDMIASENFVPRAVLDCQGSVLTNKYTEGYPGKRYYGGGEYIDAVEQLAIDRVKALFSGDHVNVQPHSGAQANAAAYFALLEPGEKIMGLALAHRGHLTHGMRLNLSGRLYEVVPYEVSPDTGLIDMDAVQRLAEEQRRRAVVGQGRRRPLGHAGDDLRAGCRPAPDPGTEVERGDDRPVRSRDPQGAVLLYG